MLLLAGEVVGSTIGMIGDELELEVLAVVLTEVLDWAVVGETTIGGLTRVGRVSWDVELVVSVSLMVVRLGLSLSSSSMGPGLSCRTASLRPRRRWLRVSWFMIVNVTGESDGTRRTKKRRYLYSTRWERKKSENRKRTWDETGGAPGGKRRRGSRVVFVYFSLYCSLCQKRYQNVNVPRLSLPRRSA